MTDQKDFADMSADAQFPSLLDIADEHALLARDFVDDAREASVKMLIERMQKVVTDTGLPMGGKAIAVLADELARITALACAEVEA